MGDGKVFKRYRDLSRIEWGQDFVEKENPDQDQIRLGCDLRSADALESLAKTAKEINSTLGAIRWSLDQLQKAPAVYRRQMTRKKNEIKKLKEENAKLRREIESTGKD